MTARRRGAGVEGSTLLLHRSSRRARCTAPGEYLLRPQTMTAGDIGKDVPISDPTAGSATLTDPVHSKKVPRKQYVVKSLMLLAK